MKRIIALLLTVPVCILMLSGCTLIRPSLTVDTKERICNRGGDAKEVDATDVAGSVSEGFIGSANWSFDDKGRAFVDVAVFNVAEGDYEISIDFHEPLAELHFTSPIGSLKTGQYESFKIGPLPYDFNVPLFAEVSLLLKKKGADGKYSLVDEADTFFLKDTALVNDRALAGMNTGGLNAQELLNRYSPILKTDVVINPETGIRYVDPGPKDIARILADRPDGAVSEHALIKCDLWEDSMLAEIPTHDNMQLFNGRKDDYFIDLPQPFENIVSPWRAIVDKYPHAIYGRVVKTPLIWEGVKYDDAIILQYWLPFYVNHLALLKADSQGKTWLWKAGNYHEGEAENISIALIPGKNGLEPLGAAYAKHFKGTAEPWENVRKHAPNGNPTSHPVVYVANGSHASFFSPDHRETTCGSSADADFHTGRGYWYGDRTCDVDMGDVKMLPYLNGIKKGDEFDFLLFTGRFGGSYIEGVVNQFNRSPYFFPYIVYPKFSVTGNWIAGSGVNRWIDPAGEIRYCATINSNIGFDHRSSKFMFDVSRAKIRKEGAEIKIADLGFLSDNKGQTPATKVIVKARDRHGNLIKCAEFNYGDAPPSVLTLPADTVVRGAIELIAFDSIPATPAKLPLNANAHENHYDYFRTTTTKLIIQ
jgi:hypothetical protein